MNLTQQLPQALGPDGLPNSFDQLCDAIRLSQGGFALYLIRYGRSSVRDRVQSQIRSAFPELQIVTVALRPLPVDAPSTQTMLDTLCSEGLAASGKPPDVLMINDWEILIHEDPFSAINPMNLGRNILKSDFPCPVLVWLTDEAMGTLFNTAPDFTSWRSGSFHFDSSEEDSKRFLSEVEAAPGVLSRLRLWWMRRRKPADSNERAGRLRTLIRDAESAKVPESGVARLHGELGFLYLVEFDWRAQDEFLEMQRLAKDDKTLVKQSKWGLDRARGLPRPAVEPAGRNLGLDFSDVLLGREQELANLVTRVRQAGSRFLVLWGDSGCGKSSLTRLGLIPKLREQGLQTVLVEGDYESLDEELPKLLQPARAGKETVVVLDQFERVFQTLDDRSRQKLFRKIREAHADISLPCRFLLLVRTEFLGRLAEFDYVDLPDALRSGWRIHLPYLEPAAAARVLRGLREKAKADWPDALIDELCKDATEKDGRVRPVQVRLAASAMLAKEILTLDDYLKNGRLRGLMDGFVDSVLDNLGARFWERDSWKRVLLALIDEEKNDARLRLTGNEVARQLGFGEGTKIELLGLDQRRGREEVEARLRRLRDAGMIVELSAGGGRYEITHDVLTELILDATRTLRDRRRLASVVLQNAIEWRKRWLSVSELKLAKEFPEVWAFDDDRAALCRRSRIVANAARCGIGIIVIAVAFWIAAFGVPLAYHTFREARLDRIAIISGYPVSRLSASARIFLVEDRGLDRDLLWPARLSSEGFRELAQANGARCPEKLGYCRTLAVTASWIADPKIADDVLTLVLAGKGPASILRDVRERLSAGAIRAAVARALRSKTIQEREGQVLLEMWPRLDPESREAVQARVLKQSENSQEWRKLWFIRLSIAAGASGELTAYQKELTDFFKTQLQTSTVSYQVDELLAWGDKASPELTSAACKVQEIEQRAPCSDPDKRRRGLPDKEAIAQFEKEATFKGTVPWWETLAGCGVSSKIGLLRRDLIPKLIGKVGDEHCRRDEWFMLVPPQIGELFGVKLTNIREFIEWAEREGPNFKCSDGKPCPFDITKPIRWPGEDKQTTLLYWLDRHFL